MNRLSISILFTLFLTACGGGGGGSAGAGALGDVPGIQAPAALSAVSAN